MKLTTLILLASVFNATLSFSQDIITTKTGEDILAKILEITKTEIRYKKSDNLDGLSALLQRFWKLVAFPLPIRLNMMRSHRLT